MYDHFPCSTLAQEGIWDCFFAKTWEIRILSRIFKHTRPRNEPGKAVLENSGTQDDGRTSRNRLESILKPKTRKKYKKNRKPPHSYPGIQGLYVSHETHIELVTNRGILQNPILKITHAGDILKLTGLPKSEKLRFVSERITAKNRSRPPKTKTSMVFNVL